MLRGGAYLAGREVAGLVLRFGGLLVLVRIIGPTEYGLYAGPLAIIGVTAAVARIGIDYHLIRKVDNPTRDAEDQAFTLLLVTSSIAAAVLIALCTLGRPWLGGAGFGPLLAVLALALPVNVLWVPAQARLERGLQYRRLAFLELGGDLTFYAVALPLAIAGAGAWAGVAGYVAWQALLLVGSSIASGYRPRLHWSRELTSEVVRYGAVQGPSAWLHLAQPAINPLVVGPLLGAAAVGQVALALRVAESLGFVLRATFRLGVVALGKMQEDAARLRRAHAEAMAVQVLVGGAPLVAFALVSPWVIPTAFGPEWSPVVDLFPWIAATTLLGGLFNLHIAVCWVKARSLPVVILRATQLALLGGVTAVLASGLGISAFGVAYAATSLAYVVVDRAVRWWFVPSYRQAVPWLVAWSPVLAAPWLPASARPLTLIPALCVVALPSSRRQLWGYLTALRRGEGGARSEATG